MKLSYYYYKNGQNYKKIKKLKYIRGDPLSSDKGFIPLYDSNKIEYLNSLDNKNRLISYLTSVYGNFDLIKSYFNNGYKDPVIHACLSKCAYYKSDYNRNVIDENWFELLSNAHKKFMTWALPTFDKESCIRFSTYYNNIFPNCFHKEFLEFLRSNIFLRDTAGDNSIIPFLDQDLHEQHPSRILSLEFAYNLLNGKKL